jgi:2-polyprenyl-6-methoxyphenol hydroxylase-like FAD-dependent oxidoreductase
VVGAGIGGLAAAAGLLDAGWDVTAFERASSLEPVGAGLGLGPNGLRALDVLGLGDAARARAVGEELGLRRPDGRWLLRSKTGDLLAEKYGDPMILLLRAHVIESLESRLPGGVLSLSAEVTSVTPDGHVVTSEGTVDADLVVAADGIGSATRAALFPAHPGLKYSGFTTWRLVTPRLDGPAPVMAETWGRGTVFGVMPLAEGRVYCYAAGLAPALATVLPDTGPDEGAGLPDQLAELKDRFGHWHDPIPSLLASASPDAVLRLDVSELARPLPSFHVGKVAFLGDAAHPMTPNLGQGACQALEDAVTLARLLTGGGAGEVPEALARYSAARRPRTGMIVKRSRQMAELTTWRSPAAVAARNALFGLIGKVAPGLALAGVDPVFDWRPPDPGLPGQPKRAC